MTIRNYNITINIKPDAKILGCYSMTTYGITELCNQFVHMAAVSEDGKGYYFLHNNGTYFVDKSEVLL